MNPRPSIVPARWRRLARLFAVLGVLVSGVGFVSEVVRALPPGTPAAGGVRLVPATGDSSTAFSLQFDGPPAPQFCPGDNTQSYLWHTFITPVSADPATLVYTPSGTPSGPGFTNNLANSIGTRSRNNTPGLGDGLIVQPANLSFSNSFYGGLTPGDYWVGFSCTLPDAATGEVRTERFWASTLTITASAGAGPNNFTYAAATAPTTTTTVAPTTTTIPGGTTTTVAGTTTTVAGATTTVAGATTTTNPCPPPGATTTTVAGATTTTTVAGATTTTVAGATTTTNPCPTTTTSTIAGSGGFTTTTVRVGSSGAGTGSGGFGSSGNLANTGASSSTPMIILWAILLVVFGRMVILLAKPIRVWSERR